MISFPAAAILLVAQVAVLALVYRRSPSRIWRLGLAVMLADLAAAVLAWTISGLLGPLNHGRGLRRAAVGAGAGLLAGGITLLLWWMAVGRAGRVGEAAPDPAGGNPGPDPSRRSLLGTAALALVSPPAMAWEGWWSSASPRPALVVRLAIRLPGLPPELDGMTILHLSDLHLDLVFTPELAAQRLSSLIGLSADLLIFTGDLASRRIGDLPAAARLLGELTTGFPNRFACLGNHDRFQGERLARRELTAAGFTPLVNSALQVSLPSGTFWLAGVNDPDTNADKIGKALEQVPPDAFVLLLAHSPDIMDRAVDRGVDLVLTGHTHGGQVVLPFMGPLITSAREGLRQVAGLGREGQTQIFVNRGLGMVTVPFRLYCPPEIALLTLRKG